MSIRKVELLYTLRTKTGKIPKGVYSVDSPRGIPSEVQVEAEKEKSSVVRVLQYDKKTKPQIKSEMTTIDTEEDVVETEEKTTETEEETKPKTTRRRAPTSKKTME